MPAFDDLVGRDARALEPRPREAKEDDGVTASFTGDQGEVLVPVRSGGWSLAEGRMPAKLRFWLDFAEGATRRDVDFAGPLFFSSSTWTADELESRRADFVSARSKVWAAQEALDNSPGGFDKLSAQGKLAIAVASRERCAAASPSEDSLSQNAGDWPTLSSRIAIARGTLSLKRGTFGFEYPTIGTWSAEPVLEGVEAARAKRLYY